MTEHPTFKFYLDAHRYLRVNGLVGAWRPPADELARLADRGGRMTFDLDSILAAFRSCYGEWWAPVFALLILITRRLAK